ncbi:MAG: flavodoxin domain-containing protein [Burkholderiaceae bacterium]|nr:flavodoxin domain-containing protein [Burkholderiaceae bacterium]MEB2352766.1 flavodoxin domain-containing protein [Burkholderiaceae bacterium]
MDVEILVGTMTGNAHLVAQELELRFADAGTRITTRLMDDVTPEVFERDTLFLVCTSTYGHGDVPDNARDLFEALQARRPDLSAVSYGVLALGDSTFSDTFAHGGMRFDRLLGELGARRIGERFTIDTAAVTLPEEAAAAWMPGWIALARAALVAA